ncbi:DUF2637 domain-containing protein [Streptomyces sp. NPDC006640]|uniref:DUF2637 domain-containing protein n=1 Tax=unclassified Streptomyces TaxID=2593676 RepID=UPI00369A134E
MPTTTREGMRQMDRVEVRAAAGRAEAEGRKTNALTDIEISEARGKARAAGILRKQAAKTKRVEEKAKRREKRAAARKRRYERLTAATERPQPWVALVVTTSIGFACPGQYKAAAGLGVFWLLATLVPVFTEGSTWAMAWMRKSAVEQDKPTGVYTLMQWVFALTAAGLNAWHHWDKPQLAVVFAASSIFGVAVFDIYMHFVQHRVGGKSAADIRLQLVRRLRHPRVSRRAAWLRSAAGMTVEQAWETAWRQIYGCAPGVTKGVLKRYNKQTGKVAALVQAHSALDEDASLVLFEAPPEPVRAVPAGAEWMISPEAMNKILAEPANALRTDRAERSAAKIKKGAEVPAERPAEGPRAARTRATNDQVTPNNPPSARGRQKGAGGDGSKQGRAVRTLAAETARAATPEQAEAEKKAARDWALERLRAGQKTGWKDVQQYFEKEVPEQRLRVLRGETWCRARIKEAEREHKGDPVFHLAASS